MSKTNIIYFEPKIYDDAPQISDHLRHGNAVIVNLKQIDQNEGARLIDFVNGAVFGIDGHVLEIGERVYLFVPSNIVISGIEGDISI